MDECLYNTDCRCNDKTCQGIRRQEEEIDRLRMVVVEACESVLENYDWDRAFSKYMDGR